MKIDNISLKNKKSIINKIHANCIEHIEEITERWTAIYNRLGLQDKHDPCKHHITDIAMQKNLVKLTDIKNKKMSERLYIHRS